MVKCITWTLQKTFGVKVMKLLLQWNNSPDFSFYTVLFSIANIKPRWMTKKRSHTSFHCGFFPTGKAPNSHLSSSTYLPFLVNCLNNLLKTY